MLPLTLLSFSVSLLFGTIPVSLGWYSPGIALLVCIAVVVLFLFVFGKEVESYNYDNTNDKDNIYSTKKNDNGRGNDYEMLS